MSSSLILPSRYKQRGFLLNPYRFGGGGGGGGSDPDFASVVSLLPFDGVDASTTFTDIKSVTWTPTGDAQIDTAQSKFGGSSALFDGSGDYITATDATLALGTGDFTIEMWLRRAVSATYNIFSWSGNNAIFMNAGSDNLNVQTGGTTRTFVATPGIDIWFHAAVTRASGDFQLFIDGVNTDTTAQSVTTDFTGTTIEIGRRNGSSNMFNGWVDDFRLTKGVARYTADFTPPTAAHPTS